MTVPSRLQDDQIQPEHWATLLTFSRMHSIDGDDDVPEVEDEWLSDLELADHRRRQQWYGRNQVIQTVEQQGHHNQIPEDEEVPVVPDDDNDSDDDNDNDNNQDYWQPRNPNRRGWVPNQRYFDDQYRTSTNLNLSAKYAALLHDFGLLSEEEAFLANLGTFVDESKSSNSQLKLMEVLESLSLDEQALLTTLHPLAFAAKANNDDTPNYHQAMNGPDALGYIEAMKIEMDQLKKRILGTLYLYLMFQRELKKTKQLRD